MHRTIAIILVTAVVGSAVSVTAFFVAREWVPGGGEDVQAGQGPRFTQEEILEGTEARDEESAKPKFSGVVNGIRLYEPAAGERDVGCTGEPQFRPLDAAAGSRLDVTPEYLPEGASETIGSEGSTSVVCDNRVISVTRNYGWPPSGSFQIGRVAGEHAFPVDASGERVEAISVDGKKAVLVKPVVASGFGESMLIVAEEFGPTVIYAYMVPEHDLVRIAEGVGYYR